MWTEDPVFRRDLEKIASAQFIPWEELRGKTVLVTGATGLIGYTLVSGLIYANRKKGLGLTVLALVRDEGRAKKRFEEMLSDPDELRLVVGTVEELPDIAEPIDYIVHGASQTASKAMVQSPAETIKTAVFGTMELLELAKDKGVKGMVYLSSMEVYGHPAKGHKVTEEDIGTLAPMNIRNSYPIGKLQSESLCCAYAAEYGVPAKIIRLTQTFGPGVNYNDTRVFAEFGRCVREGRDIVLRTKGETERSYLYTADAVTAILTVLLRGTPGQAYNAADESTYCSIAQMAELVAKQGGIHVRYEIGNTGNNGYPDTIYMDMDTAKLRALGWKADTPDMPISARR